MPKPNAAINAQEREREIRMTQNSLNSMSWNICLALQDAGEAKLATQFEEKCKQFKANPTGAQYVKIMKELNRLLEEKVGDLTVAELAVEKQRVKWEHLIEAVNEANEQTGIEKRLDKTEPPKVVKQEVPEPPKVPKEPPKEAKEEPKPEAQNETKREQPGHFVNTNYNGATVTNEVAEQLKQQPAAELLRFTQQGDKTVIQSKLPEKGAFGDPPQEYDIRVNMNYLMRGMASFVMGPDGSIDLKKADKLDNWLGKIRDADRIDLDTVMDDFKIPEDPKRREDFKRFLHANGVTEKGAKSFLFNSTGPFSIAIKETFSQLAGYQLAVSGKLGPEAKEYALSYQVEYEQMLSQYRDMVNMDPEKEDRMLVPTDCYGYANMNEIFIKQHNAWRRKEKKEELSFQPHKIVFKQEKFVADEEGNESLQDEYNAFDGHGYITLPVKIDGQDSVLSLETTAPPEGDLFHRRNAERTGVGIFPTAEAVEKFHRDNNVRKADFLKGVPGAKEREIERNIKDAGMEVQGKPDAPEITMPKKTYHGYLLAHTGARTGPMNAKQLADTASKAIMASYFMNDPKAPAFNVGTIRKAAENLRTSPQFLAVLRAMREDKVREALTSGDITKIAARMYEDPDKRYKLEDASKKQLRELGESMKTEKRSAEWVQLKRALTDPSMKNSMDVIAAVEQYTKGKKSVRRTQAGRESFQFAMKALAIAARDGDDVAKQRAKILADRINAVRKARRGSEHYIDLAVLAPAVSAAQAGQFDAEKYIESLDPGAMNPSLDLWMKTIADVYKPVPVPNEQTMNNDDPGYKLEEFKQLKQYDVSRLHVGGETVGDIEFTALTAFAMNRPETGGSYMHAPDGKNFRKVPEHCKPSQQLALNNAFTFGFTDLGSGGGYGIRKSGQLFKGVSQPSREIVYNALQQYRQGNKQALGKLIGQGVDGLLQTDFGGKGTFEVLGDEKMTLVHFANSAVKLAQRDPELRRIAEKNGLTKENLQRLSGIQKYDAMSRIALAAKKKLEDGENLSPEEKKACVTAVLRYRAVAEHQNVECAEKLKQINRVYNFDMVDAVDDEIAAETDPDKLAVLKEKRAYVNEEVSGRLVCGGTPPTMQALGHEGEKTVDRLMGEAKIDVDKLMTIGDTKELLKTIESKDLFIQKPGQPDKFAQLRESAKPQAGVPTA